LNGSSAQALLLCILKLLLKIQNISYIGASPAIDGLVVVPVETLEKAIYPVNFYKTKAKRLKECCQALVEKFHGEVPNNVEDLTELPGVGKKTASMVVLGAFGQPAVVVDRHVLRVLNRLGFNFKDADVAEEEIRKCSHQSTGVSFPILL